MIYLAAPFFSPDQLERITMVEQMLDRLELQSFSPRLHGGILNEMTPEVRQKSLAAVFRSNVEGVAAATLMLAGVDDKDTGTTWEMGFFYGLCYQSGLKGCPLLTYSFYDVKANVMLSQSTLGHLVGIGQLERFFTTVRAQALRPIVSRDAWLLAAAGYRMERKGTSE